MSIYVIPTPSGSHITDGLEKDSRIKLMYPEGHSKTRKYVISGGETYCRLPDVEELQQESSLRSLILNSSYTQI